MLDITIVALGPLALIAIGVVVLWTLSRVRFGYGRDSSLLVQFMRVLAWLG